MAKYRAMAVGCYEVIWLLYLLKDFNVEHFGVVKLFCDNQSAFHVCKNSIFHECTKHVEMDCHFIRDKVVKGVIEPCYVSTKLPLVGFSTKGLQWGPFHSLLCKMSIMNIQNTHLEGE